MPSLYIELRDLGELAVAPMGEIELVVVGLDLGTAVAGPGMVFHVGHVERLERELLAVTAPDIIGVAAGIEPRVDLACAPASEGYGGVRKPAQ